MLDDSPKHEHANCGRKDELHDSLSDRQVHKSGLRAIPPKPLALSFEIDLLLSAESRTLGTSRLKALANYPVGGPKGFEPYVRRTLRFQVNSTELAAGEVRLLYFLMKGNHPRVGRKQRHRAIRRAQPFSTVTCLPPGGI